MVSERDDARQCLLPGTFRAQSRNLEKKGNSMTIADMLKGKDRERTEPRRMDELEEELGAAAREQVPTPNALSQAISQGKADEQDPTGAMVRNELQGGVLPPDADDSPIDERFLALNIRIKAQREERVEQLLEEKATIEAEIASEERAIRMAGAAIEEADRKPSGEVKK